MTEQEKVARTILDGILENYPVINSLESHEDKYKAIIKLNLGGFKVGKTPGYAFPLDHGTIGLIDE